MVEFSYYLALRSDRCRYKVGTWGMWTVISQHTPKSYYSDFRSRICLHFGTILISSRETKIHQNNDIELQLRVKIRTCFAPLPLQDMRLSLNICLARRIVAMPLHLAPIIWRCINVVCKWSVFLDVSHQRKRYITKFMYILSESFKLRFIGNLLLTFWRSRKQ